MYISDKEHSFDITATKLKMLLNEKSHDIFAANLILSSLLLFQMCALKRELYQDWLRDVWTNKTQSTGYIIIKIKTENNIE